MASTTDDIQVIEPVVEKPVFDKEEVVVANNSTESSSPMMNAGLDFILDASPEHFQSFESLVVSHMTSWLLY